MPPQFVNPHFLPDSSIIVSRREIYAEQDDSDNDGTHTADPQLVNRLKELIYHAYEDPFERSMKRRKIRSSLPSKGEEPITFRLLSSAHPILLRPKSPPPPLTREPETEDNAQQAALRAERAKASAVDGSTLLTENCAFVPRYGDARKSKAARVTFQSPSLPVMMVVESRQSSRSTRPPVPAERLRHYPYKSGPVSSTKPRVSASDCPVIEIQPVSSVTSTTSKRKRRRKTLRDRLPPAFWRPDPAVGGKCLGYAMGFPCSVEVLQSGNTFTGYRRDTMRKFAPT